MAFDISHDTEQKVTSVSFSEYEPDDEAVPSKYMKVTYGFEAFELIPFGKEDSHSVSRTQEWWEQRSRLPVPKTVEEAIELANAGALAVPAAVRTRLESCAELDHFVVDVLCGPIPKPR